MQNPLKGKKNYEGFKNSLMFRYVFLKILHLSENVVLYWKFKVLRILEGETLGEMRMGEWFGGLMGEKRGGEGKDDHRGKRERVRMKTTKA